MGILNLTPDSFYDGGKYTNEEKSLQRALEIQKEGADMIDIGAQSTKPGHKIITPQEEWSRLETALKIIRKKIEIPISVDTFYPQVAEKALNLGADIINDITGFQNTAMFEVVKNSNCGLIVNHNYGNLDIKNFFQQKLEQAKQFGISPQRICFDPGIGFNKTRYQDAYIINNIDKLKVPENALLVGASRKRILSCNEIIDVQERLPGTIVANVLSCLGGANIVRVHDVYENVTALKTLKYIKNLETSDNL